MLLIQCYSNLAVVSQDRYVNKKYYFNIVEFLLNLILRSLAGYHLVVITENTNTYYDSHVLITLTKAIINSYTKV